MIRLQIPFIPCFTLPVTLFTICVLTRQYTSVQHKGVRRNIKIAEKDKADPAKHDFLLEFIWKLKTFMHYHCFDEFKDKTYLHDLLQQSIEAVFTEDLLLRW
jgi:hypothetical protein